MKKNWRSTAVLPVLMSLACASGGQKDAPGAPVIAQWAALTSGAVEATMSIQNDWKAGYCSDITVKNNGLTTVTGWTVVLNLHQSTLSNSYSSKSSGSTFTPESYNASIAPGASIKFGFCASATGTDYLATIAAFSATGGTASSGGSGTAGAAGATMGGGAAGSGTGTAGSMGTGTASSTGGTSSGGGSASLVKSDDWNSGYCANVNITGTSNWTVVLDMRNSAIESGQLWSGSYTSVGSLVTVKGTAASFRFCARKTATADNVAVVRSINGTASTGGGTVGGGTAGAGGSTGGTTSGGTAGAGGSTSGGTTSGSCPTISGTPGWTSRFWDCCKPHCGWSANVSGGVALSSCSASNQSNGTDYGVASSCSGGSAYMCYGLTPWAVSSTLAYGYAATPTGTNSCGKCYEVQFTGAGNNGSDPGSTALKGKTMIVQSINVGGDVNQNQFDLMVPGGGVGLFNACASQWGVSNSQLGAQYGGLLAACKQELGFSSSLSAYQGCLRNKCTGLFSDARGLGPLREGCLFYVDWFMAADNPQMVYKEVACPSAIQQKSNLRAGSASNSACGG